MRFSIGNDYKDAVMRKPESFRSVQHIREFIKGDYVILDYKAMINGARYHWRWCSTYVVHVIDNLTGIPVFNEKTGKPLVFRSIYKCKEWMYEHEKEYYDSLPNLREMEEK